MEQLKEYLEKLESADMTAAFCIDGEEEAEVRGVTFDSKEVVSGGIFVCKGKNFRVEYLKEALERGCICYVSEKRYELSEETAWIQVKDIRKAMPVLAAIFYRTEPLPLHLTGVTGTKGKTTTSYYIKAILDVWEKKQQGKETGILSSVDIYDGKELVPAKMTTPEAMEIHRHIRNCADESIRYLTMEVSSQALKYKRVRGLKFDVGIFLNISEDHISPCEHENFEDYFTSKLSLFKQTKVACVNLDSAEKERILSASQIAEKVLTFGTTGAPDIWGHDIEMHGGRISFWVRCDRFHEKFNLRMHGLFNVENALAAICAVEVVSDFKAPVGFSRGRNNSHEIPPRLRFLREVARNGRRPRIRRVVQIGVCGLPDGRTRRIVGQGNRVKRYRGGGRHPPVVIGRLHTFAALLVHRAIHRNP